MLHRYKELKYLFCWGLIYGVITYIKCDTPYDMDTLVIATILTILIFVIDNVFINKSNVYNIPRTIENMTSDSKNNPIVDGIFNYFGTIMKKPDTDATVVEDVSKKLDESYKLEKQNDVSISDVLDKQAEIENIDLDRHPPATNAFEQGYSFINPDKWYQPQSDFYTKGSNRCLTQPIYIDSTTIDLKEWANPLIGEDVISTQNTINHVKNNYNS